MCLSRSRDTEITKNRSSQVHPDGERFPVEPAPGVGLQLRRGGGRPSQLHPHPAEVAIPAQARHVMAARAHTHAGEHAIPSTNTMLILLQSQNKGTNSASNPFRVADSVCGTWSLL